MKVDTEREREGERERERERERNLKGFQRTRVLLCTMFAYIKGDQYNKMQGYPKIYRYILCLHIKRVFKSVQ